MAIAQTILTQDLADELVLIDATPAKVLSEMLDLQRAAAFFPRTKTVASTDYSVTAGSDICIITDGARQLPGESGLSLLQRNVALFEKIAPRLAKYSPDAILLVVSNRVDVLTYVAWTLSGFPPDRVIGSGSNLDSSMFRFSIADHLGVNAQDVQKKYSQDTCHMKVTYIVGSMAIARWCHGQGLHTAGFQSGTCSSSSRSKSHTRKRS